MYPQALHRHQCIWYQCNSRNAYDVKLCLMGCLRDPSAPLLFFFFFHPPTATPFMICDRWIEGRKSRDRSLSLSPLLEARCSLAHSQHILTELFFFTFFTGERNTFKAIILCLDKHEIYPPVIIELREAFKEVSQCTVKDLHTSPQTASRLLSVCDTLLSYGHRG